MQNCVLLSVNGRLTTFITDRIPGCPSRFPRLGTIQLSLGPRQIKRPGQVLDPREMHTPRRCRSPFAWNWRNGHERRTKRSEKCGKFGWKSHVPDGQRRDAYYISKARCPFS